VLPCLENLDLPYADDSAATTPTSDDLCSFQNAQNTRTYQRQQRLSTASAGIRMSQLELMRFTGTGGGGGVGGVSRTGSRGSRQSRHSVVASNAAALTAGATTTQLEIHAPPRLKVKYFCSAELCCILLRNMLSAVSFGRILDNSIRPPGTVVPGGLMFYP